MNRRGFLKALGIGAAAAIAPISLSAKEPLGMPLHRCTDAIKVEALSVHQAMKNYSFCSPISGSMVSRPQTTVSAVVEAVFDKDAYQKLSDTCSSLSKALIEFDVGGDKAFVAGHIRKLEVYASCPKTGVTFIEIEDAELLDGYPA